MIRWSCSTSMGCSSRPLTKTPVSVPRPPPEASAGSGPPRVRPGGRNLSAGPPHSPAAPVRASYQYSPSASGATPRSSWTRVASSGPASNRPLKRTFRLTGVCFVGVASSATRGAETSRTATTSGVRMRPPRRDGAALRDAGTAGSCSRRPLTQRAGHRSELDSGLVRVRLVEQDGAAEHLRDLRAGAGGERLGLLLPPLPVLGGELHLHQLVVPEGLLERGEHAGGDSLVADLHDDREVVTEGPELPPLLPVEAHLISVRWRC